MLLETATLVLLNENMAHGAAFKVRGPVTTSLEVVVVGRIGWSVNRDFKIWNATTSRTR